MERGNVDEAFKNVDRVYEGKTRLRGWRASVPPTLTWKWDDGRSSHSVGSCDFCSGQIRTGGQEHFYMETQSVLVIPVGEEMEFRVYASSQWPALIQVERPRASLSPSFRSTNGKHVFLFTFSCFSRCQTAVAETLNIPSNRVSCHVKRIGGAFGGKATKTSLLACIASVAAWKYESFGTSSDREAAGKTLCVVPQDRPRGALRPGARRGHADHRRSPPLSGKVQGAAPPTNGPGLPGGGGGIPLNAGSLSGGIHERREDPGRRLPVLRQWRTHGG